MARAPEDGGAAVYRGWMLGGECQAAFAEVLASSSAS
jgi:hypothetical protein